MNIIGLPPASFVKKCKPKYRSRLSIASVAVRIGKTATMIRLEASVGPAEHRHAQIAHAGAAHLQHRGDEVYPRHQRADAGDLHRPEIVVDADARASRSVSLSGG